ncbi:hypothetical protein HAX54_024055, partial [Datura stramonium]|nr:hypothetical protein [Datura stramonium]
RSTHNFSQNDSSYELWVKATSRRESHGKVMKFNFQKDKAMMNVLTTSTPHKSLSQIAMRNCGESVELKVLHGLRNESSSPSRPKPVCVAQPALNSKLIEKPPYNTRNYKT